MELIIAQSEEEVLAARKIRKEVFVIEQGIPEELDLDADESRSINILVQLTRGEYIGTGRLTINQHEAILSRICILKPHRKGGIGKVIIQELERIAREKGAIKFRLSPHEFLERFYASLGYRNTNENHQVGPYLLLTMVKD